MPNPTAAMLVIGDEILSGRTRDANTHYLAGIFSQQGVDLCEARVVADDPDAIVGALNDLRVRYDHVITSGGIGPTHDDITADCVARAFGVCIDVRDDARAILAERYAKMQLDLNEARLRMARIPDGAALIPNPVSGAPGFTIGNVHVMAGVPSVFQAMVAEVLPQIGGGEPLSSQTLKVSRPEGEIAGPLGDIAKQNPDVSIGSYPYISDGEFGSRLVARSHNTARVSQVITQLQNLLGGTLE